MFRVHSRLAFRNFISSYLILLVITCAIFALSYAHVLRTVADIESEKTLLSLRQVAQQIHERFTEIESIALQLIMNPRVTRFSKLKLNPMEVAEFYELIDYRNHFPPFSAVNSFVDSIYIYFRDPEVIVGYQSAGARIETFYKAHLSYTEMSFEEWHETVNGVYLSRIIWPAMMITTATGTERYLTYLQSFPLANLGRIDGVVIATIRESAILDLARTLAIGDDGWFAMVRDDEIMASRNVNRDVVTALLPRIGAYGSVVAQGSIVVYTESPSRGWSFLAGIPRAAILSQADTLRKVFLIVVSAALGIGVVMSVLLSARQRIPVQKLLARAESLEEIVEKNRPYVTGGVMERLLRGTFGSESEFVSILADTTIVPCKHGYFVGILQIGHEPTVSSYIRMACTRKIAVSFPDAVGTHMVDRRRIAILLPRNGQSPESVPSYTLNEAVRFIDALKDELEIDGVFGFGSGYASAIEISQSFREARRALLYGTGKIRKYEDLSADIGGYYYPLESETRLANLILTGDYVTARDLVDELFEMNSKERLLNETDFGRLSGELEATFMKLYEKIIDTGMTVPDETQSMAAQLRQAETLDELHDSVLLLLKSICGDVDRTKKSHNERLASEIVAFMKSNFNDPDLRLTSVASRFGISEKYLSDFFKEQTGIPFHTYLSTIRIQVARELLDSHLSVSEAAARVGYTTRSFSRAFRKAFGVSPASYQNNSHAALLQTISPFLNR